VRVETESQVETESRLAYPDFVDIMQTTNLTHKWRPYSFNPIAAAFVNKRFNPNVLKNKHLGVQHLLAP